MDALRTIRSYIDADEKRSDSGLSRAIGRSRGYLHRLLSGHIGCSTETADALADKLVADGWLTKGQRRDFWEALVRLKPAENPAATDTFPLARVGS